jgi:hypothetical protein
MAVRYCDGAFEIELAAAGQLSDIRRTTEWLRRESLESLTSVRMPMRAAASTDPATAEWQVRPRSEAVLLIVSPQFALDRSRGQSHPPCLAAISPCDRPDWLQLNAELIQMQAVHARVRVVLRQLCSPLRRMQQSIAEHPICRRPRR